MSAYGRKQTFGLSLNRCSLTAAFGEKSGHSEDSTHLLPRVFSAVGVCSGLADKAKPAERRGRKATGPRFLREATDDLPKVPKTAELPTQTDSAGAVNC